MRMLLFVLLLLLPVGAMAQEEECFSEEKTDDYIATIGGHSSKQLLGTEDAQAFLHLYLNGAAGKEVIENTAYMINWVGPNKKLVYSGLFDKDHCHFGEEFISYELWQKITSELGGV